MKYRYGSVLARLVVCVVSAAACRAENWPGFRGPTGLGYTAEKDLPIIWGGLENKNVLWKSPVKGQGHASPIVWEDRVFVCTVYFQPDGTANPKVMPEHHVACYGVA